MHHHRTSQSRVDSSFHPQLSLPEGQALDHVGNKFVHVGLALRQASIILQAEARVWGPVYKFVQGVVSETALLERVQSPPQ